MGQREEIERLVGEAYADLRLQKWGEFDRKVSELSLYPKGLVEDIIREKMGKVQQPTAMRLASIHEAVTAFPETEQHTASGSEKGSTPQEVVRLPELEKPENARWLALLIDTEGSLGWTRHTERRNHINGYRYEHTYANPYISAEMKELESKETIEQGARLVGVHARSRTLRVTGEPTRFFVVSVGRARETMRHIKPHLVKFERLANLCLTLFKHHTYIPLDRFKEIIQTLFGRYVTPAEANETLLSMTEEEYKRFLTRAENLAPK